MEDNKKKPINTEKPINKEKEGKDKLDDSSESTGGINLDIIGFGSFDIPI